MTGSVPEVALALFMLFAGIIIGWQMHGVQRANPDDDEPVEKPE